MYFSLSFINTLVVLLLFPIMTIFYSDRIDRLGWTLGTIVFLIAVGSFILHVKTGWWRRDSD